VLGLWEEVEKISLVELSLSDYSSLKQRLPALIECAVEKRKEDTGVLAEDVTVLVVEVAEDVDLPQDTIGASCHCERCKCLIQLMDMFKYSRYEGRNAMGYAACGEGWAVGR